MVFKRSSRGNEPVPRRRHSVTDSEANQPPSSGGQYRRNQTLSKYRNATPESDESSRHKAHQLVSQRRRLSGVFLIVAAASILLLILLWQLIIQVHITASSKQLTATFENTTYEQQINEYLTLNPAQRLRFALDEPALSSYVSSKSPEVESIAVNNSAGIGQAAATITFRTPVAGWQINGNQYYVDVNGVVFEKNFFATPGVQIVDESGIPPDQGGAVVGTRLLGFLGRVVAQADDRGYTVKKAVLPEGTTRQVDVYFKGISTRVKFSVDRGAGEQFEDAQRSLKYLKAHGIRAGYIDVRVAGKAAYK